MELHYDLYKIIIDFLPYKEYINARIVCSMWYQYIETTDFQKVLQLIRIIKSPPDFFMEPVDYIRYLDGIFTIKGNYTNFYRYDNGKIVNLEDHINQPIQKINNNHGDFELYYSLGRSYIKVNDKIFDKVIDGSAIPRFIKMDDEIHIMDELRQYKYENDKWILVPPKLEDYIAYNIYRINDITYTAFEQYILILKNNEKLGIIKYEQYNCKNIGIGNNYLIIKYNDKTCIWNFPH